MDRLANPALEAQLAASLDWWRDAGVDALFHDAPTNWIAPPPAKAAPRPAAQLAKVAAEPASTTLDLPATLADFTAWWLAEPALDGGRTAGRVPPRGPVGAKIMVLVEEPERDDGDTLLSGLQGKLLDAMLTAMGIAPGEAYVASVLPRHTPHPDWESVARLGIGRAAAHHVKLVGPAQLVSFGSNIPSLAGNHPPNSPTILPIFHHEGTSVLWLADRSLGAMLERPRWKAGFWQKWLDRAGAN